MKKVKSYFENFNFSIWDIFKDIPLLLKIQILHYYFNGYSSNFAKCLREELTFQDLARHLKDNLQKFAFNPVYVGMNEKTKKYFSNHIGKTISLYFLIENLQSDNFDKLKTNPFLLAMLKGIFELDIIITCKNPQEKNLFQPFHSLKVILNKKDITSTIEKANFFYTLGEDFGDGVINEKYNKKTNVIDFSTVII